MRKFREVGMLIRRMVLLNVLDHRDVVDCLAAHPPSHSLRAPWLLTVRLEHPSDDRGDIPGDLDDPAFI